MAYVCELAPGHHVYLENQGNQTIITTTMGLAGQQQQASNTLTTGPWTAPPEAYQSVGGAVFKLFSAQGDVHIHIQGNSINITNNGPSTAGAQQLSMQQTTTVSTTMQPMQPMTMGTMQMTMNPMEMRMGKMELKMDTVNQEIDTTNQIPQPTRQFCSQCGTKVAATDRFCSNCGHALG